MTALHTAAHVGPTPSEADGAAGHPTGNGVAVAGRADAPHMAERG